jgi:NTE family protein
VLSFAPLENQILDSLGDIHIEDLLIPMAVVATDLATFRTVVIREGCLARAVRASCSVPGIVTPVEIDGRMLADGGASNNMPAQITRDMGAEYVIGVDLFQPSPFHKGGPVGGTITMIERFVEMSGGGFEGADYVITPKLSGKSYLRFSQSRKMVELGREAARAALPDLRRELAECGITCREVH